MLYKYCSINENSLTNLANSTLWFSKIADFNDSFEGRFKIKKKYPNLFQTYEQANYFYSEILEYMVNNGLSKENIEELERHDDLQERIEIIFNFFTDPIKQSVEKMFFSEGYCCFSKGDEKILRNSLMWSHYANGLRGYCLGFDEKKLQVSLSSLNQLDTDLHFCPVEYSKKIPILDLYSQINAFLLEKSADYEIEDFHLKVRATKASAWKYEREWRAISVKHGTHKYAPDSLVEVFFGEKMPTDKRKLIEAILLANNPKAIISNVRMAQNSYELGVHREK